MQVWGLYPHERIAGAHTPPTFLVDLHHWRQGLEGRGETVARGPRDAQSGYRRRTTGKYSGSAQSVRIWSNRL